MSLNACEERIFDYLQNRSDEGRFWQEKVRAMVTAHGEPGAAASRIESALWLYYVERSAVVPAFRAAVRSEGLQRMSLRNLSELLIRLWTRTNPPVSPAPGAREGYERTAIDLGPPRQSGRGSG